MCCSPCEPGDKAGSEVSEHHGLGEAVLDLLQPGLAVLVLGADGDRQVVVIQALLLIQSCKVIQDKEDLASGDCILHLLCQGPSQEWYEDPSLTRDYHNFSVSENPF